MKSRLGDLGTFVAGSPFPQVEQGAATGDYPFAKVSDLAAAVGRSWDGIDNWVTDEQVDRLKSRLIPTGSTVFAKIGEGLRRERMALATRTVAIDNNLMAFIPDVTGVDPAWMFYRFRTLGISDHAAGSALPYLRKSDLELIELTVPSRETQEAIGEVLGALDDKITANRNLCSTLRELQESIWARESRTLPLTSLIALAPPKLGGTPARSNPDLWGGGVPWASVRDMTGADFGVVLSTAETITINPGQPERLSPVPAGSVFITARGTVGKVATAGVDCAFNQSAYAFVPQDGRGAALRLAVESAVAHLIARAHGSVFSTITTSTLVDAVVPDVSNDAARSLVLELDVLEQRLVAALRENGVLARTRDELLPLLMNGRITVKDAERAAEDVL